MLRELFRIVLRQWATYTTLLFMLVFFFFIPRGDFAARAAQWYFGGIQVLLLLVAIVTSIVRQKREINPYWNAERQREMKLRIQSDCGESFFHGMAGVAVAGVLFMITAQLFTL